MQSVFTVIQADGSKAMEEDLFDSDSFKVESSDTGDADGERSGPIEECTESKPEILSVSKDITDAERMPPPPPRKSSHKANSPRNNHKNHAETMNMVPGNKDDHKNHAETMNMVPVNKDDHKNHAETMNMVPANKDDHKNHAETMNMVLTPTDSRSDLSVGTIRSVLDGHDDLLAQGQALLDRPCDMVKLQRTEIDMDQKLQWASHDVPSEIDSLRVRTAALVVEMAFLDDPDMYARFQAIQVAETHLEDTKKKCFASV